MTSRISISTALVALSLGWAAAQQTFTINDGQLFTPGYAIVDSPMPGTPLGGSQIEVALDVSADGVLPLGVAENSPSMIHNITVFMYSYETGRNFSISNGTVASGLYGPIMQQEPGSTVKHVKWTWPRCLVGNGQPATADSPRGIYNISIHQHFRLNNTDYYTIFDLPISVTNSIDNSTVRPDCNALNNPMLTPAQINMTAANQIGVLFAPGDSKIVEVKLNKTNADPDHTDADNTALGMGGAAGLSWSRDAQWISALAFVVALCR